MSPLSETAARRAIAFVEDRARLALPAARESLARSLQQASREVDVARCVAAIRARARATVSFHPDRVGASGASVAQSLLEDGIYRSQFETRLSNGSLTAFPGGARDGWERTLFGNAYHEPPSAPEMRPKYGGLDLFRHADGACPRFGSCFFVLRDETLARATLTWGDSHLGPAHVATWPTFEAILAPLFETLVARGEVLGRSGLDVDALLSQWVDQTAPVRAASSQVLGRALDAYIEAQIHGPLRLAEDVRSLVIDPSFDGTPVGADLVALAERHGLALERRAPLTLPLSTWSVPEDFRGPAMQPLAAWVVARFGDGAALDAATIGRAAVSRATGRDLAAWADRSANEAETLQQLKQLWHVLVAFGQVGP